MHLKEAQWVKKQIEQYVPDSNQGELIALNFGCGTLHSRTIGKPWIHQDTVTPLEAKGYQVIHSDLFEAAGVDLHGDLFDEAFQHVLRQVEPTVILLCNILEHLRPEKRRQVPGILKKIIKSSGVLIVTVPRSYPYHADPLDTLFRPGPEELAALFSLFKLVKSEVLECGSYAEEFQAGDVRKKLIKLIRLMFPMVRPRRWLSHAHRLFWLRRPYLQTVAVFRAI